MKYFFVKAKEHRKDWYSGTYHVYFYSEDGCSYLYFHFNDSEHANWHQDSFNNPDVNNFWDLIEIEV